MSIKVLHVISGIDPVNGGPVTALKGLAEAQVRAGLEVSIAATWCKGTSTAMAEQFRQKGIAVHLIGPAVGRLMSWHPQIKKVLHEVIPQVDVVHIHALWEEIQHQAARVCQQIRTPYVITPHGMLSRWSLSQSGLKKKLYMSWRLRRNLRQAALFHFTTRAECEASSIAGLKCPMIIEPLGIDLAEFENLPPLGSFRARHPQIGQRKMIVFLGRIHPGKGLEHLVPAMAKVRLTDTVLVVIGPDSEGYKAVIQQMIAENGLQDQVVFAGALYGTDKVAALRDADLFALPSDHENFGIAIVEALAAGTPVLISDQVNICNEIADAGVGGVVPITLEALAAELKRWLCNAELRQQAAAKASPFVHQQYGWKCIAEHWVGHYQQISLSK